MDLRSYHIKECTGRETLWCFIIFQRNASQSGIGITKIMLVPGLMDIGRAQVIISYNDIDQFNCGPLVDESESHTHIAPKFDGVMTESPVTLPYEDFNIRFRSFETCVKWVRNIIFQWRTGIGLMLSSLLLFWSEVDKLWQLPSNLCYKTHLSIQ